jgi:hypothetical protein
MPISNANSTTRPPTGEALSGFEDLVRKAGATVDTVKANSCREMREVHVGLRLIVTGYSRPCEQRLDDSIDDYVDEFAV